VLAANAGTMRELAVSGSRHPGTVEALLRAAPGLRLLETGVDCEAGAVLPALRKVPPFGPLRLTRLFIYRSTAADLRAVAETLAAHTSLEAVSYIDDEWPEAQADSDALAEVLASLPRLASVSLRGAPAPALARLLGCRTLKTLRLLGDGAGLLDWRDSTELLCAALRANTQLEELELSNADLFYIMHAAASVLAALQAHPSLRVLNFSDNYCPLEYGATAGAGAAAGAALGALIAASPSLTELDIRRCCFGDAGLGPVMDALPHARRLHTLNSGSYMSEAFARERLLPAVRACTTLHVLDINVYGERSALDVAQTLLWTRRRLCCGSAMSRNEHAATASCLHCA
jgi:hypothetical protein